MSSRKTGCKLRIHLNKNVTPQERAEWAYKEKIGIAKAFSEMAVPSTMIVGGGAGGEGLTSSLIQAAMAKQLMKD